MRSLQWVLVALCVLGGCKSKAEAESEGEKRLRQARLSKFKRARARDLAQQRRLNRVGDAAPGKAKVLVVPAARDAGVAGPGSADATSSTGSKPPSELLGEGPPREPYDGKPDTMRPALVAFKKWDRRPRKQREKLSPVINAATSFTLDLFGRLGRHRENLSFAPWSLWSTLTLLSGGATGATRKQLRRLLHLSVDDGALRKRWKPLDGLHRRGLRRAGFKWREAAGLWVGKDVKLRPEAVKGQVGVGHASVRRGDVKADPEKARLAVNRWVTGQVGSTVRSLIPRGILHVDVKLLIVSAVTLSGSLGKLFPRNRTFSGTFYLPDCKMVQVPMMNSRSMSYFVSRSREVQIVDIPLRGGDLSLTLIMANRSGRLAELQATFTSAKLRWWFGSLQKARGKVTLPRLELGKLRDLAAAFKELGLGAPFGKGATFGTLADPGTVRLETVLHRTPLILREAGVKAPGGRAGKRPGPRRSHLRRHWFPRRRRPRGLKITHNAFVDRPFVLLLRHRATGAILYLARVYNPHPGGRVIKNPTCTTGPSAKKMHNRWRRRRRRSGRHWRRHFVRYATILGGLDGDDVRKVMQKHRTGLEKCVKDGHKAKPPFKGTARVGFTIRTKGTVGEVHVTFRYRKHAATAACLKKQVRRMKFGSNPAEPTVVGFTVGTYHSRN